MFGRRPRCLKFGMPGLISTQRIYQVGHPVSGKAWSFSSQAWSFSNWFGCKLQICNEAMRLGIAILNCRAMHILDFWVKVIPHPSDAILSSGVTWALNLRTASTKTKPCAWFHFFRKSQNLEPWRPAFSHSLTHSPSTHLRDSIAIPTSLMRGGSRLLPQTASAVGVLTVLLRGLGWFVAASALPASRIPSVFIVKT